MENFGGSREITKERVLSEQETRTIRNYAGDKIDNALSAIGYTGTKTVELLNDFIKRMPAAEVEHVLNSRDKGKEEIDPIKVSLQEKYKENIQFSLEGSPDEHPEDTVKFAERRSKSKLTIEDGNKVGTAVYEARKKAGNMSQRELEVEAYEASQVLNVFHDLLREKYKFNR